MLGQLGELTIPSELQLALGLEPGDRLHLQLSGSQLVLEHELDAVIDEPQPLQPAGLTLAEQLLSQHLRATSH